MNAKIQQAVAYFVHQNWTLAQACGVTANLQLESGLNQNAVGDGGAADGLAQWHPDRQAHFQGLFGKRIQDATFEEELAFVHAELVHDGWEKRAGDALAKCETPEEAAEVICRQYERPADKDGESRKRAALARQIFNEISGQVAPQVVEAPQPQGEQKMGALLPGLLMSLVSGFTNPAVAQSAASLLVKGDGPKSTAAETLLTTLLSSIAGAAGVTTAAMKADDRVAIQAVAAVQSDAEKLAVVEKAAADHLNAIAPFVKMSMEIDQARWTAENQGKQTVSSIAIEEHKAGIWDMTKWLVVCLMLMLWGIAWGLLAAIIALLFKDKPDPALLTALFTVAGGIWSGAIVTSIAAIIAYRFDGSKNSQAAIQISKATENYREETK